MIDFNNDERDEHRDARGRWRKGAPPGPGRPRPPAGDEPPDTPTPAIGDGDELVMALITRREAEQAWTWLIETHGIEVARERARDARERGRWVPPWPELATAE